MSKRFVSLAKSFGAAFRNAPAWVENRGPNLTLLPFVLAAPLILAGPLRCTMRLSLPISCAIACAVCALAAWVFRPWTWPRLGRVRSVDLLLADAAAILACGFAVWALYNRDFGGFPNLDGWDGGTHVFLTDQFGLNAPDIYNGQVAYYGFTWLVEKILGVDAFRSFTIAFYLTVVATVAFPMMLAFSAMGRVGEAKLVAVGLGAVTAIVASAGVLLAVILPVMHYNEAAGYYSHLFGLIPLFGLWAADAQIRQPWLRVGVLLAGLAVVRYTYALNLADVTVAVAALLLFDGTWRWQKLVQALLAAGLCIATVWIARQIAPLFQLRGGIQGYATGDLLRADIILSAGLLLYAFLRREGFGLSGLLGSPVLRALRFPVFLAAANAAFFSHFREIVGAHYYYLTKYQVWTSIVLASALVVALAHLVASFFQPGALRRLGTWLGVAVVSALLATVPALWMKTFAGYRQTLLERMEAHGPPYKSLRPLADVEGTARIKAVLAAEHKHFGGYLTAFFPMFSFMNAMFGHHPGYQEFFPPDTRPGNCVFWVTRPRDTYLLGPGIDKLDALRNSVAAAGSACSEYPVPWKTTPQSLCYRCY